MGFLTIDPVVWNSGLTHDPSAVMGRVIAQVRAARKRGLGLVLFSFETLGDHTAEPLERRLRGLRDVLAGSGGPGSERPQRSSASSPRA